MGKFTLVMRSLSLHSRGYRRWIIVLNLFFFCRLASKEHIEIALCWLRWRDSPGIYPYMEEPFMEQFGSMHQTAMLNVVRRSFFAAWSDTSHQVMLSRVSHQSQQPQPFCGFQIRSTLFDWKPI